MAQPTSETETNLFDGVTECRVSLPILDETYQELRRLIEENEWDEEEGLRIILTRGLAYLKGEAEISQLQSADSDLAEDLNRIRRRLMEYESMYAVMKFTAFRLREIARTLELNVVGLRGENNLCHSTLRLLREEIARLKAENARLKGLVAEREVAMSAPLIHSSSEAHTDKGFRSALNALLHRRT